MDEKTDVRSIHQKVEEALQVIRPYLEADGGDVKILDISDRGIVRLELLGACGTCPMSTMTLKAGVEEAIKRAVPEVTGVEAINITSPDDPNAQLPDKYL
ncbi:MAG: NifU family protein [Cytophagales bacterium]|nr:NifU family protein [Cytophagales bacterium]